jgi:hypothetical protein
MDIDDYPLVVAQCTRPNRATSCTALTSAAHARQRFRCVATADAVRPAGVIGWPPCEPICERNPAQLPVWRGTRRDGLDAELVAACMFEMPGST